jgi:hypothetical protein
MHGGPSTGAPKGNKNALKRGYYSMAAKMRRREVSALLSAARDLICKEQQTNRLMRLISSKANSWRLSSAMKKLPPPKYRRKPEDRQAPSSQANPQAAVDIEMSKSVPKLVSRSAKLMKTGA